MHRSTDWVPSLWKYAFKKKLNDDIELVCGRQWRLNFNYSQTENVTEWEKRRGWKIFICNAYAQYASFKCGSCRNTWRSAQVKVLFRYRRQGAWGAVVMRPLRQACRPCNNYMLYIRPGFSRKEIERVLLRLFAKIRKYCYRVKEPDVGGSCLERRTKPHERALCEACRMGICQEMDN